MVKLHTSPRPVDIHNLKNVLGAQGIACEIRGELRGMAVGELPPNECWVELWLVDDADEDLARRILARPVGATSPAWTCGKCGESVEGQFDRCWKCEGDRPDEPPA